jgi:hypothetical protein
MEHGWEPIATAIPMEKLAKPFNFTAVADPPEHQLVLEQRLGTSAPMISQ